MSHNYNLCLIPSSNYLVASPRSSIFSQYNQFIMKLHLLVGDSRVPSGALEYKSLLDQFSDITVGFCEWSFSHEPLILKAFNFDAGIVNFGEYGRLETYNA